MRERERVVADFPRGVWIALIDAPWRVYPAALLMLVGGVRFLGMVRHLGRWLRPVANGPLVWTHSIRRAGFGLFLFLLGAAWFWRQAWVFVFALVVSLDTFGEYGTALTALQREQQAKRHAAPPTRDANSPPHRV